MELLDPFLSLRKKTEEICAPLQTEDFVLQTADFVSPPKWHLAHTSWFFETFLLKRKPDYRVFHPLFHQLFNSYYETVGPFHPRPRRGQLSRPTVSEIFAYRGHVSQNVARLLRDGISPEEEKIVELGIHHEQQHQELLLMDILYNFSQNPLFPAYADKRPELRQPDGKMEFGSVRGGTHEMGHAGGGFCFDNETPRHRVHLEDAELGLRLVTHREYREFVEDGGYENAALWLSDGWTQIQKEQWKAPLYWKKHEEKWHCFTLAGLVPLPEGEAVSHLSFYEADAFCRWAGWRLPTEAEWECAASGGTLPPSSGLWEWTQSAYSAYPRFKPLSGSLGEYNGKFMCNQFVLRGASFATPPSHRRITYRNFFAPDMRWQFCGLRPARDA